MGLEPGPTENPPDAKERGESAQDQPRLTEIGERGGDQGEPGEPFHRLRSGGMVGLEKVEDGEQG